MSSQKKRARELARRRESRWQERQAARAATRRRRWSIAAAVSVVALVGVVIAAVATQNNPSNATTPSPTATNAAPSPTDTGTPPSASLAEGRTWTATLRTNDGDITVELDGAAAPQAVASFVSLAQSGFFDGTSCHRLTTGDNFKLLQCGDPNGNGSGGPDYRFGPIENAPADGVYPAGTVAMARVSGDANSMGSQFFLVYGDTSIPNDNAGGYTVFGKITSGLDVLQAVADAGTADGSQDGRPATPVTIEGVETQ